MTDFHMSKETTIDASPEAIFAIVGDLTRYKELAGSGELMDVRVRGPLDKPEITARPLRSIDAALRTLFQPRRNRSPSNRREQPH